MNQAANQLVDRERALGIRKLFPILQNGIFRTELDRDELIPEKSGCSNRGGRIGGETDIGIDFE